jgi:hypothetical protein
MQFSLCNFFKIFKNCLIIIKINFFLFHTCLEYYKKFLNKNLEFFKMKIIKYEFFKF